MPFLKFHFHPTRDGWLRALLVVLAANALLSYPQLYSTYKQHDFDRVPQDRGPYFALAQSPLGAVVENPFKYRILTPILVRALRSLPTYDIDIASNLSPAEQRTFLHLAFVNWLFLLAASLLVYRYARAFGLAHPWAHLASLAFLFTFFNVVFSLGASVDAGAHCFIAACLLTYCRRQHARFVLAATVGVLAKETVVLVVALFLCLDALANRRALRWLALLVPAIVLHVALRVAWPAPGNEQFFSPQAWTQSLAHLATPAAWSRTLFFHTVLAHAPFVAALLGDAYLRWRHKAHVPFPGCYLLLPAGLFALGAALDLGNNIGRIVSFAGPLMAVYEVFVLRQALAACGVFPPGCIDATTGMATETSAPTPPWPLPPAPPRRARCPSPPA